MQEEGKCSDSMVYHGPEGCEVLDISPYLKMIKGFIAIFYILPGIVITFVGAKYGPKVMVFLVFLMSSGFMFGIISEFSFMSKSMMYGSTKIIWIVLIACILAGGTLAYFLQDIVRKFLVNIVGAALCIACTMICLKPITCPHWMQLLIVAINAYIGFYCLEEVKEKMLWGSTAIIGSFLVMSGVDDIIKKQSNLDL